MTHPAGEGPGDQPRALLVERTGPMVTVQDLGRPGLAALGVSRSGAADRAALRRANRLVANAETDAGLEVLLGGLTVRADGAHLVLALSGADCPALLGGRPVPVNSVLELPPGTALELGTATAGLRCYLAVRGGLATTSVLGSRSRDTLASIGPQPLRPGDLLPVGEPPPTWPILDLIPMAGPPDAEAPVVLRATDGPRADWLDPASSALLWSHSWTVSAEVDRIGLRLTGPALRRPPGFAAAELPSEGLVRGAVQVPPGGPVLFLADHPVTGGYPVAAVVAAADVDLAAQLRPGQLVRLRRPTGPTSGRSRREVRGDPQCPWWGW
jgi:biotin-dependent carboxylase-like uncharacterized protein